MSSNDYIIVEITIFWRVFEGVGWCYSRVCTFAEINHNLNEFLAEKRGTDIYRFSNPVWHDIYSNKLIFYYLIRPRREGMF